jgi:hypothetical protein
MEKPLPLRSARSRGINGDKSQNEKQTIIVNAKPLFATTILITISAEKMIANTSVRKWQLIGVKTKIGKHSQSNALTVSLSEDMHSSDREIVARLCVIKRFIDLSICQSRINNAMVVHPFSYLIL